MSQAGLNNKAVAMFVLGMGFLAVQEGVAKYLGQHLSVPQVVWARYTSHLAMMLVIFLPTYGLSVFKSNIPFLQVGRSMLLFTDSVMFFTGLTLVGLAEATAIFFIVPLLVLLLSIPLLKEKVGIHSLLAILVGFIGMLVIVRPGIGGLGWGAVLILLAAICMSLFNISTRKLAGADKPEVTMVFTAMVGFIAASIAVPFFWVPIDSWVIVLAMVVIGIFGGIAHNLIILSHEQEQASKLAPFMYSQILFAIMLGWLMFDMLPDQYTVLGTSIVIASGLYLWRRGRL